MPLQPVRRTPSTRRRSIIDMTKRFHAPQHSTAPKHPPRNKRRGKSLEKVLKGGAECKGPRFFVGFIGCSTSTAATSRGDVVLWFRFQARCLRRSALHSAALAAAGLSF